MNSVPDDEHCTKVSCSILHFPPPVSLLNLFLSPVNILSAPQHSQSMIVHHPLVLSCLKETEIPSFFSCLLIFLSNCLFIAHTFFLLLDIHKYIQYIAHIEQRSCIAASRLGIKGLHVFSSRNGIYINSKMHLSMFSLVYNYLQLRIVVFSYIYNEPLISNQE